MANETHAAAVATTLPINVIIISGMAGPLPLGRIEFVMYVVLLGESTMVVKLDIDVEQKWSWIAFLEGRGGGEGTRVCSAIGFPTTAPCTPSCCRPLPRLGLTRFGGCRSGL